MTRSTQRRRAGRTCWPGALCPRGPGRVALGSARRRDCIIVFFLLLGIRLREGRAHVYSYWCAGGRGERLWPGGGPGALLGGGRGRWPGELPVQGGCEPVGPFWRERLQRQDVQALEDRQAGCDPLRAIRTVQQGAFAHAATHRRPPAGATSRTSGSRRSSRAETTWCHQSGHADPRAADRSPSAGRRAPARAMRSVNSGLPSAVAYTSSANRGQTGPGGQNRRDEAGAGVGIQRTERDLAASGESGRQRCLRSAQDAH